mmetsp:Transcript_10802/g.25260  ORF Transcript_10802/g.25260 Transcript_10802/m.25260 type:complete len:358 (-) Transcript_10802:621-1694(-)
MEDFFPSGMSTSSRGPSGDAGLSQRKNPRRTSWTTWPSSRVASAGSTNMGIEPVEWGFKKSTKSSFSSSLGLVMRWSNSFTTAVTRSPVWATQLSFCLIFFTEASGCRTPSRPVTLPGFFGSSVKTLVTSTTPHMRRITRSPTLHSCASSASTRTWSLTRIARGVEVGSEGTDGTVREAASSPTIEGTSPPESLKGVAFPAATPMNRGAEGSNSSLLRLQNLSHSIHTMLREAPCITMNLRSACMVTPRRTHPCTVGNRGSNHPSTASDLGSTLPLPTAESADPAAQLSTNHWSFRLESTVLTKFTLPYSQMRTVRSFIAPWSQWYCALRSLNSVLRRQCVTPSIESTMGHTKSYVG